jgi:4-amino-4-deoxy-L-arabinose transferase-like glycosyltransferase
VLESRAGAPPRELGRYRELAERADLPPLPTKFPVAAFPLAARVAAAGLVVLAGLYQNLLHLGQANLTYDEPLYASAGWQYVHGNVSHNLVHPPLAKYLIGLSELTFGHTIAGARLAAVVVTFATAAVLWRWGQEVAGWWTGTLAAALWLLLPHRVVDAEPRLDRFGTLEPFVACFVLLALYCGWRWSRTGRWGWVVLTGLAVAAATTAKENGVLVVPPVVAGLLVSRRGGRTVRQLLVAGAVAVAGAAACYLPAGNPVGPVRYLLGYQLRHAESGHAVLVAGQVYLHPPWWSNLWFTLQGYGAAPTAALVLASATACLLLREPAVRWLLGGLASLLAFHCLLARVALPSYYLVWQPELTLLAALGICVLARRLDARLRGELLASGPAGVLVGALAGTLAGVLAAAALTTVVDVAKVQPHGLARLTTLLDANRVTGPVLISGFPGVDPPRYLRRPYTTSVPPDPRRVAAVVVPHTPVPTRPVDPGVRRLIAANLGRLALVRLDEADVYLPTTRVLTLPL